MITTKPQIAFVDVPQNILRGAQYVATVLRYRTRPLLVPVDSELAKHPATILAAMLGIIQVDGSECGKFFVLSAPPADRGDA